MLLQFVYSTWTLILLQGSLGHSVRADYPQYDDTAPHIIARDVCIIGGGASGSYAAIRLQEMGKSVVMIEKEHVLGGHTNTYTDPATNSTIDYGVQLFHNTDLVKSYFAQFDIPLAVALLGSGKNLAIDFRTGKPVEGYIDPATNVTAFQEALTRYATQLSKYPYLQKGFYLPESVPEDLLMSFGDFIKKYELEAIAFTISTYAQGFGDFLSQPALYVLKYFSLSLLENMRTGFLTTASGNNGELYAKIQKNLGPDVLLGAQVTKADRNVSGKGNVKLVVRTSSGEKLIHAAQILVTIPPTTSNMQNFGLNSDEVSLFSQFGYSGYYTGILKAPGLTLGTQYTNVAPNTPYNIPILPGTYSINPSRIAELFTVTYGTLDGNSSLREIEETIINDVERVTHINRGTGTNETSFVAFNNHSPYELTVPPKAIADGFYRDLYALQGKRNTWYTGAAFQTHDSSELWNYTESLLPAIVAAL